MVGLMRVMVGSALGLRPEAGPAYSSPGESRVPACHPPSAFFLGSCHARHGSFLIFVHHTVAIAARPTSWWTSWLAC